MAKVNTEEGKSLLKKRNDLAKKIFEYEKEHKQKSDADLKTLVKWCKEYEVLTNQALQYDPKVKIWHKKLDYNTWEPLLKKKTSVKAISKKPAKTPEAASTPECNLYYIMLCWTNKNDYFVCGSIIDKVKSYFEKLKLEFFDTQSTKFPDRVEHCSTFKFRGNVETYDTIIKSAEYIIDISASTVVEHCNVGVFGQKIE